MTKMAQKQKPAQAAIEHVSPSFSTWLDFGGVGSVGITVSERDGVCVSVERAGGGSESRWLGAEKRQELYRALAAYMDPREKARLQAEALAKLSPAERWALGIEER